MITNTPTTEIDDDFVVTIKLHPEERDVRGNASAIDDETDRAVEDDILARLENGDAWAWCVVEVEVEHIPTGRTASRYLGGCNYEDEADFCESGYYQDMVEECREELTEAFDALLRDAAPRLYHALADLLDEADLDAVDERTEPVVQAARAALRFAEGKHPAQVAVYAYNKTMALATSLYTEGRADA